MAAEKTIREPRRKKSFQEEEVLLPVSFPQAQKSSSKKDTKGKERKHVKIDVEV
jgi:hypothetical protein